MQGFRFVLFLLAAGTVLSPLAVFAQDAQRARARQAFEEGAAHYADHRYLLAAEAFRESYDLLHAARDPDAGLILYNIATSLDEVPGREREARAAYAQFLAEAPAGDAETQRRMATVQARIRELDARLAIETEGRDEAEPETSDEPANPAAAESPDTAISPVGPILMGVGGAAAIVGAVFGGLALGNSDTLRQSCGGEVCADTSEHRSIHEEMTLFAGLSDGLIGAGAVIAVVGLVLTFTLETGDGETVSATATCVSDGCVAVARGAF